jgi:hypothetical protein
MMMPLSLFGVNIGVDVFNLVTCFPKSALSRANEIACLVQMNGSHMNSPSVRGVTNGGCLRSSELTVEVQNEWTVVMRQHDPAIGSPKSG